MELNAIHSPFTTFCEGPEDVEKGYKHFYLFHRKNYSGKLPEDPEARILVVSSGVGYFQNSLRKMGYKNVSGIDSDEEKVNHAIARGFQSECADCFEYLERNGTRYELIFAEQEVNHLTRDEFLSFLNICHSSLSPGGRLIISAANCANPLISTEYTGNNIDHYTLFTENNMKQFFSLTDFQSVEIFPHDFYVLWTNPLNYIAKAFTGSIHLFLKIIFRMYGKSNKIFTKRLGVIATKQ